jgi:hypothetical protein
MGVLNIIVTVQQVGLPASRFIQGGEYRQAVKVSTNRKVVPLPPSTLIIQAC